MPYDLRQWPSNVYPEEANEYPDATAAIDVVLREIQKCGPQLEEYGFKTLGKKLDGLWQINLKIRETKRQIRILYRPYGNAVVVFHIHKKSSKQEQQRAYALAIKRKRQAEQIMQRAGTHVGLPKIPTIH